VGGELSATERGALAALDFDGLVALLRELIAIRCAEAGIELRIPPIHFCTDNGAMIAALGAAVVRRGLPPSPLSLPVDSSMPLTQVNV